MAKTPKFSKAPDVSSKNRHQALDRALQQIERAYGEGAIMKMDGESPPCKDAISSGALSLDMALGGYGIPRGRIVEIYGPESSGKTTLALNVVAEAQKADGVAAFVDVEHALDPVWMKRNGVNIETLLVSQPDGGEQALEITDMLVRSNAVDVIVIDSVAALIPRAELEGDMGDTHVGHLARLMSQAMRKLTAGIGKSKCIVIFINQIREKIGVMFGSPETTPGGRALKFYSSVRIDVRRIASIKEGDRVTGNQVRARVVKNKVAPPFREAMFDIMFDSGISATGDLLELGVKYNVIEKQGAWFRYGSLQLGQGRENSKRFLADNPDLFAEIRAKVMEACGYGEKKDASDGKTAEKIAEKTAVASDKGGDVKSDDDAGKDRASKSMPVSKSAPVVKNAPKGGAAKTPARARA